MSNEFVTLIVPNALVAKVRNLTDCMSPAGAGMWSTPLSANGTGQATHWISSGYIRTEFSALLLDASGAYAAAQSGAVAQGKTLTVSLSDVQAIIADSDISSEPPFDAMARLGLQIIDSVS